MLMLPHNSSAYTNTGLCRQAAPLIKDRHASWRGFLAPYAFSDCPASARQNKRPQGTQCRQLCAWGMPCVCQVCLQ